MITPILKKPRPHGGTLYTFPSASRDLTRSFTNSEYEFAFSHFACLNLPDIRYGNYEENDLKGIYLDDLYPNCIGESGFNLNNALKWHIQSYVMNYEVAILNGFSLDSRRYNSDILRNPSERIFFSWLQKVNAIKFNGNTESLEGYGDESGISYDSSLTDVSQLNTVTDKSIPYRIGNKLYTWKGGEWKSRVLVSKTVQYIGTIDMINNVNIDYDSFNEIYLNIPAGVGGSTDVYFDNIFDDNYEKGNIIDIDDDEYCTNADYIIGRNPEELDISDDKTLRAIYESNFIIDEELETGYYASHTYTIRDGYCINFNDSIYDGGSIETMNLNSKDDFEFNCVLIYYRIRRGNGEWYTNLYGVLFLEEVATSDFNTSFNNDDELAGYIQRYPKFKDGNSWGLKLDLKIDAQPDSQMVLRDSEYDDPNGGAGMQMFTEALMHLNDCTKLFYDVKNENTDIEKRLYILENIVSGIDTVYDLINDVGILRTRVEMFQPIFDALDGRVGNIESEISKLKTNLGYLIQDLERSNSVINDINGRLKVIENLYNYVNNDGVLYIKTVKK